MNHDDYMKDWTYINNIKLYIEKFGFLSYDEFIVIYRHYLKICHLDVDLADTYRSVLLSELEKTNNIKLLLLADQFKLELIPNLSYSTK